MASTRMYMLQNLKNRSFFVDNKNGKLILDGQPSTDSI